jgi:hypothetical protein
MSNGAAYSAHDEDPSEAKAPEGFDPPARGCGNHRVFRFFSAVEENGERRARDYLPCERVVVTTICDDGSRLALLLLALGGCRSNSNPRTRKLRADMGNLAP